MKELEDNNFTFDEKRGKLFKRVENTVGKKRNCLLREERAISPFPAVFSKDLFCSS